MRILLSPFTKPRRDGKPHAKDYPYWDSLIPLLKDNNCSLVQIGLPGERQLTEEAYFGKSMSFIIELAKGIDTFISVDSFFPHFMNLYFRDKTGIVLFGPSDPAIYGYSHNYNLYVSRLFFRHDQFGLWESCEANPEAHVRPLDVLAVLHKIKKSIVN